VSPALASVHSPQVLRDRQKAEHVRPVTEMMLLSHAVELIGILRNSIDLLVSLYEPIRKLSRPCR
jgi:hypothetical protein